MTDATPLASEQITQEADLLTRAKVRIAIGKQTGAHTANRLNIYHIAEELLAALSATPAPSRMVPLDEPNCTNDDYLRRKALTEMVAMDEQMEVEHPGWMTGEATSGPSEQDASQAQGEVVNRLYEMIDGFADFMDFVPAERGKMRGRARAYAAMIEAEVAPGATAQDGERDIPMVPASDRDQVRNFLFHAGVYETTDTAIGLIPYPVAARAVWDAMRATPTPTIPAGMVVQNLEAQRQTIEACARIADRMNDGLSTTHTKIAAAIRKLLPNEALAAAPKQAEQQGVEAARRALRVILSENKEVLTVTVKSLVERARAALNAPTGAVEKGEAK